MVVVVINRNEISIHKLSLLSINVLKLVAQKLLRRHEVVVKLKVLLLTANHSSSFFRDLVELHVFQLQILNELLEVFRI